jgi:hypothetical protein
MSPLRSKVVLIDATRFYILSATNKILVCNFPASSISAVVSVFHCHTHRGILPRW